MKAKILRAVVTAGVMSGVALVPGTPALAAVNGDYIDTGVRIRKCPDTACTSHGLGYPGQGAAITCYKIGQYVGNSAYWYYHRNRATGVVGYSHSSLIDYSSGAVSRC
jgi:hypothetical protein